MLSSFGKQTAVEMLEFQSPSKIQAQSRYLDSIIAKKGEKEITEDDSDEEFEYKEQNTSPRKKEKDITTNKWNSVAKKANQTMHVESMAPKSKHGMKYLKYEFNHYVATERAIKKEDKARR